MTQENDKKLNHPHSSEEEISSECHSEMDISIADSLETGLQSVEEFLQKLKEDVKSEFERDEGDLFFYRGQADKDWKLIPALFRDKNYLSAEKQTIQELLSRQAQDFSADQTMFEFLVRAQHYSHPTRLLDITRSPLIALYFACADEENIDKNGTVTVFKIKKKELAYFNETSPALLANLAALSSTEKKNLTAGDPKEKEKSLAALREAIRDEKPGFEREIHIEELQEPVFVQPQQNNERLIAQQGAFLLFGLETEGKNIKDFFDGHILKSYEISGKKKGEILKELEILGIHESTIYPGLEHCAAYLKDTLNRLKIDADRGNPEAQFRYGERCYTGYRAKQNFEEALKYFKKAADQRIAEAQLGLGVMYKNGEGITENPQEALKEALKYFKKAADQGNAEAQCNLALMFFKGEGCEPSVKEARDYWERAASQNYPRGQYNLGIMYHRGEGRDKEDLSKALKYYKEAADQGYAKAQVQLGLMCYTGEGCNENNENYKQAFHYWKLAANQKNAEAQFHLGLMYENDEWVKKDLEEAFKYYKEAADQGFHKAQFNLGLMYYTGDGCAKNLKEARRYWEMAATQKDERALFNLGSLYENGDGVKADLKKAADYYTQAAALGFEPAKDALENLKTQKP